MPIRASLWRDLWVKLAKCCAPVPGDDIVGFVTRGNGVSVHHAACANAEQMREKQADRFVPVRWSGATNQAYMVHVKVEALDRSRLLTDLADVISELEVNILSASAHSLPDRIGVVFFSFELADPSHLRNVLTQVRKVSGVFDAYRVTSDGKPM